AMGQVEEAALASGTRISLPPLEHLLHRFDASGSPSTDGAELAGGSAVGVDRRRVFDGRTFLRLVGGELAGTWIESNPAITPTEPAARRVLAVEERAAEARLVPGPGERTAFRFDDAGRVIERRPLSDGDPEALTLTTRESRVIGVSRFAVIASGDLAGWSLAEGPDLQIVPFTPAPEPAD
ncbi:MAG: hypothetical protein ACRDFY_11060, partial [Candidatus Limnocylindria bacterium]